MEGNKITSKRIASNTILLYMRMLFIMIVDLYMVRIVLNSLGAVDYGIFDVVAGVILMFQSISSVLTISTQRFYSFSLGRNEEDDLRSIFSSSVNVYLVFSVFVLFLSETIGVMLVNSYLDIPKERMAVANWIFQFSVFSFIFSILQIPFSSAVIANEDMGIYSVVSILNCVLKLIFALSLSFVPIDKLAYYGAYLTIVSLLIFIIYALVGHKKYSWCKYSFKNSSQIRQIMTFSGWTLFGTTANVGINQVCTILVNVFFGPVTNAARAISFQINGAINAFCGSFLTAIRPPMIKSYAEGSFDYLNILFNFSNKVVFYLLLIVCLPLFMEMDTVLFYWLKTTDPQAVLFSRLIVIYALLLSLNNPITFIIHAMGRVKEYHVLVELPTLLCAPTTYLLYKMGFPAYTTYLVLIIAIIFSHIIRLGCLRRFYKLFDLKSYLLSFCMSALLITVVSCALLYCIHMVIVDDITRILTVSLMSPLFIGGLLFLFGFDKKERMLIYRFLLSLVGRIKV